MTYRPNVRTNVYVGVHHHSTLLEEKERALGRNENAGRDDDDGYLQMIVK